MMTRGRGQSLQRILQVARRRVVVATRRDGWTVTFLVVAAVLPFAHLRFGSHSVNGFIACSRPMEAQWYVYFLCQCLSSVSLAVFVYEVAQRRFKIFAWLWLWYCVYDLLMFLWCCNERNFYYLPYGVLLLITIKLFKR